MKWVPVLLAALLGWNPIAQPLPESLSRILKASALKSRYSKCVESLGPSPAPEARAACGSLADESAREYEAALAAPELSPETKARIYVGLGELRREEGKSEEALANYALCLALAPDNLGALEGRAQASEALGKWENAAESYRKLNDRKPGDSRTLLRLARIYAAAPDPRVRRPQEAVKLAKQVSDMRGGTDPEALGVYAEALFANGDTLSAIDAAKRALLLSRDPAPLRNALDRYERAQYEKVVPPAPKGERLPPASAASEAETAPWTSASPSAIAPTPSPSPPPVPVFPENKGSLD